MKSCRKRVRPMADRWWSGKTSWPLRLPLTALPSIDVARTSRSNDVLVAQLLLAGNSVMVAVHLRAGAVPQEERRLCARSHLRAMGAAVTSETRIGGCPGLRQSAAPRPRNIDARRPKTEDVLSVPVPGHEND